MDRTINLSFTSLIIIFGCLDSNTLVAAGRAYEKVDWNRIGQDELKRALNRQFNNGVAKNVILFLGDGNGLPNIFAARVYKGQLAGKTGEETRFVFEDFPNVGLSKTYNVDHQVPDSAGTATSYLCGVKAKFATVGVNQHITLRDCSTQKGNEVYSILHWSMLEGKSTGVVTNTRITHATPAASYAHAVHRDWETDSKLPPEAVGKCEDIASQLVTRNPNVNVFMGGARVHFLPNTTTDFGDAAKKGTRKDGRNLIEEWKKQKKDKNLHHKFVWNPDQLKAVDPATTDYLLGLFATSHMEYEALRCPGGNCSQPSLVEMTEKAIQILKKNDKGFFLLVESGRLDHAHHFGKAKKALIETIKLEEAVKKGIELTNEEDTLIVVTADHSHTMMVGGYPSRGNPILGLEDYEPTLDKLPFTTIMYGNGPGYVKYDQPGNKRLNLSTVDTEHIEFKQPAAIPAKYESHGGEDVSIYAKGPMAHLFFGVHEQNYIAHAMAYASCVGRNKDHCNRPMKPKFCSVCSTSPARKLGASGVHVLFVLLSVLTSCVCHG